MAEYKLELRFKGAMLAFMYGPYPELASAVLNMKGLYGYNRIVQGSLVKEMWTDDRGHSVILFQENKT